MRDSTSAPAGPRAAKVALEGLTFAPATLEVETGTMVTWTNEDSVLHTVTSGDQGEQGAPGVTEDKAPEPDGLFDEELRGQGSTFSFTFDEPGTYSYFCNVHRQMSGDIVVE